MGLELADGFIDAPVVDGVGRVGQSWLMRQGDRGGGAERDGPVIFQGMEQVRFEKAPMGIDLAGLFGQTLEQVIL